MEKNKKISNVISFILMGVAAVAVAYSLFTGNPKNGYVIVKAIAIANLLALVCGIIYTAKGSTKNASLWLKCFEGFLGLSVLGSVARAATMGASPLSIVRIALSFGLLCILSYAENLGKKRSYCLGGILIVLEIVSVVKSLSASTIRFGRVVNQSCQLLMLVILVLLIAHKYKDKDSRGTV